ncbi:imidazolonepropionase [Clostridium minihomine]|uniref:imidazolonepropionase n=1 Tax=Clostridium minihomine TaxID=2045012 RepID=UPI000C77CA98|nr:imidazolonepropionase [Clostridium minihomine]
MSKKLICHAAELVTCAGKAPKHGKEMSEIGIIHDGAVLIDGDKIIAVGTTEELKQKYDGADCEIIDATGKTVMPGFVDCHTHFVFGGYRADEFSWRLRGDSYMSIMERGGGINASVSKTRAASLEELVEAGRDRMDRMLEFGVTTVEGKSGYGLDKETELKQLRAMKELNASHPVDVVSTFMGPHSVLPEYKGKEREFIEMMLREVMPIVKEENLAEFADIFTEKNVFSIEDSRYYLNEAKKMGFHLKIHADEIVQLGGAELAAEVGATSAEHLLQSSEAGIAAMAKSGVICTTLPATAFSLKEEYANARRMIEEGAAVAIASDLNPGSCFTNSIPLLIALSCIYMGLSIEEVITALTINGAAAVNRADKIGSIEPGKQADIIFLRYPSIHFLPYHTAINLVDTVMKNGEIVLKR